MAVIIREAAVRILFVKLEEMGMDDRVHGCSFFDDLTDDQKEPYYEIIDAIIAPSELGGAAGGE